MARAALEEEEPHILRERTPKGMDTMPDDRCGGDDDEIFLPDQGVHAMRMLSSRVEEEEDADGDWLLGVLLGRQSWA